MNDRAHEWLTTVFAVAMVLAVVLAVVGVGYAVFAPDVPPASASVAAGPGHSVGPSSVVPWSTPARLDRSGVDGPPGPRTIKAKVTGYSWQDNTPAGSAEVSHPVMHEQAGGTGTYDDPITVAVGHSLATGTDVLDWPAGTRFYFPTLQRYGVAEDTCGDGPSPELKACHKHVKRVDTHLDVWVGGEGGKAKAVNACMARMTGEVSVIVDPPRGKPVTAGPVFADGWCRLP